MPSTPPILQGRRTRLVLVAVLTLVGVRALLPFALAWGIEWGGTRSTGLPVSVGDVDLGLLRGALAIERVAVAGVGAAPSPDGGIDPAMALLRFERLGVNLQWLSLLRGRIHLAELTLAEPFVGIELDEFGSPRLPEAADEGEVPAPDDAPTSPPEAATSERVVSDDVESAAGAERVVSDDVADEGEPDSGWPILIDRLAITGADVRVRDPALRGEAPAVELGFGSFELAEMRWQDGALGLGGVGLDAPILQVRRDYVLAERPPAPDEAPAEAEAAGAARAHRMERLAIERAEFTLLTDAGPVAVALGFEAADLTTAHGQRFPLRVDLEIGEGSVQIAGEAGIDPPSFAGRVAWEGLPAQQLALAADPSLSGWLRAASASGQLDLLYDAQAAESLVLAGQAQLDGFHFAQPDGDEVSLRWKSLAVDLARVTLPATGAAQLDVAAVRWVEPKARYTIPAPALEALLGAEAEPDAPEEGTAEPGADPMETRDVAEAAPETAPAAAPGEPTRLRVRRLTVTGGDVHFVDRSVEPAFEGRIASLEVSASELRVPENRAGTLRLTGSAPGGAGFSLDGVPEEGGRLVFELERLGLDQFQAYTASAVGYRARGAATLRTEIDLRKDRIDVGNKLVLHEIGLESKGDRAVLDDMIGMPVDLALGLLRDLRGDIRLRIPLSVDRGGVRVSIGTVIRDAVRRAIAGAVLAPLKLANTATSPLKALGALTRGAEERLSIPPLDMVPGRAELTEGAREQLVAIVDFLNVRPQLRLVLHGRSDESDRDGLAHRVLVETVQSGEDLPELEGAGFFTRRGVRGALAEMGRGKDPMLDDDERALLERYLQAVYVPPPRYDALARERAEHLRDELVQKHGVDASRVKLEDEAEEGDPGVRVALGLLDGA